MLGSTVYHPVNFYNAFELLETLRYANSLGTPCNNTYIPTVIMPCFVIDGHSVSDSADPKSSLD